jgi:phage/plasmid-associated DNA primase
MNKIHRDFKGSNDFKYAEKQNPDGGPLFIDIDIDHFHNEPIVKTLIIKTICNAIYIKIRDCFDISNIQYIIMGITKSDSIKYKGFMDLLDFDSEVDLNGSSIVKSERMDYYREGFHIIVPSIILTLEERKTILLALKQIDFKSIMKPYCLKSYDPIDLNSANVPVFILGSCKPSKDQFDPLIHIFKFVENSGTVFIDDILPNVQDLNLAKEFSFMSHKNLTFPRSKILYNVLNKDLISDFIVQAKTIKGSDINLVDPSDSLATYMIKLIDLIDPSRAEVYESWNKILYAISLVKPGNDYVPIMDYFSKKCINKFKEGESLKKLTYNQSKAGQFSESHINVLKKYAKLDNPEGFNDLKKCDINIYIRSHLFDAVYDGIFSDKECAHILQLHYGDKFISIPNKTKATLYEFIDKNPNGDPEFRSLYKYKERQVIQAEMELFNIPLVTYFKSVIAYIKTLIDSGNRSEHIIKNYNDKIEKLSNIIRALSAKKTMSSILEVYYNNILNTTFYENLNKDPLLLGVYNGVLYITNERPILINNIHSHPITKCASAYYIDYDPTNQYIRELEDIFRQSFPYEEQSTYECIMMWYSLCLTRSLKPVNILLLTGNGSEGKSLLSDFICETLSKEYILTTSIDFLNQFQTDAQKGNPLILEAGTSNGIIIDEVKQGTILNDQGLKKITGGSVSARQLYSNEIKQAHIDATITIISNINITVTAHDGGTWRRLLAYKYKISFRDEDPMSALPYDPNNKMHRKKNLAIGTYKNNLEYRNAFLAILLKWFYIYKYKYNANFANVPKPYINQYTAEYRLKQDYIYRWIRTCVIACDPSLKVTPCKLSLMKSHFRTYLSALSSYEVLNYLNSFEQYMTMDNYFSYFIEMNFGEYVIKDHRLILDNEDLSQLSKLEHLVNTQSEPKLNDTNFKSADFKDLKLSEYIDLMQSKSK